MVQLRGFTQQETFLQDQQDSIKIKIVFCIDCNL